jgi:RecB family exonuclease
VELKKTLPLEKFRGLQPEACLCVGQGYSREDFKTLLLEDGEGFVGNAVLTFPQLVQKISGVAADKILSRSPARQEILRMLLSIPAVSGQLPELKRLKRQGSFLKRLDIAIQNARMSFLHWEEEDVYSARLNEKNGEDLLRVEVEKIARAYEDWMTASELFDPPMMIRQAIEVLSSEDLTLKLPQEIYYYSVQESESLEKEFWEKLARVREIHFMSRTEIQKSAETFEGVWQRWHTLDDAADFITESLVSVIKNNGKLTDHVVLIGDLPEARRSLRRALISRGVMLADLRDPTRSRWDEGLKQALLPLVLVARGFEREQVLEWIQTFSDVKSLNLEGSVTQEILERGIRSGIESYSGGRLAGVHAELSRLQSRLGGKKTVQELGEAHLKELRRWIESDPTRFSEQAWVIGFFETIWKELVTDLARVGLNERRAAPLYWVERLQSRVAEAPSPAERLKPEGGLDVFRFHQRPVKTYKRVWFFGIPSSWLSGEGTGDYWFSEKDREVLSSEFAVRSGHQIRQERAKSLGAWTESAEEVTILDAAFEVTGRERETISSVIQEIETLGRFKFSEKPVEMGSHTRWMRSYGALRPVPPQEIKLPPRAETKLSATLLDSYSRCSFIALAQFRWRLRDLREPDTELWPDVRGNILHEAVRILVESRDGEGNFSESPENALESAWALRRPKGLLRGARVESYVKRKLKLLLIAFCEKEREYVKRAQTKVLGLENIEFEIPFDGFSVVGEPDRIDEHPDGLFIMDYKTSSKSPKGSDMLEDGYRLQLPFYAIAAQKKFGKSALGFQFIQFDKKGTRSSGMFFKSHNGKDPGKLTATTANSKSLVSHDRDEVWKRFEEHIQSQGTQFIQGLFKAFPNVRPREDECKSCRISDLCGFRRIAADSEGSDE